MADRLEMIKASTRIETGEIPCLASFNSILQHFGNKLANMVVELFLCSVPYIACEVKRLHSTLSFLSRHQSVILATWHSLPVVSRAEA
jgi:hypothetical protein